MDATTIEIALASDSRFFPGLFMTACSIAHFADRNVKLVFHVLDGGIPQAKKNHLREVLNAHHPSIQINWLSIDIQSFKDLPEWRGCGKMNWARLLLPKLLPESKWVAYLDTDFLCLHDIAKLWASKSDDAALLSVPDDWRPYVESERA